MIIVVAAILAVATVPLSGRSLMPLATLDLRRAWLVWLSIGLQLGITLVPGFPAAWGEPLHLFTFAISAMFMWANRHIRGTLAIATGAAMNFAAIAANGGTMPASAWAWRTAGYAAPTQGFENSGPLRSARLQWLGDVFAIPKGWPMANVFSVGDVVIVIGVAYLAHVACRRAATEDLPSHTATATAPAALSPTP